MAFWCYGKNNFCDNNSLCPEGCEYFNGNGGEEREMLENQNDAVNDTPRWISVEDRLPEEPGEVLMVLYGRVCIAWYHCDGRFESGSGLVFSAGKSVTHWMPLPEPPKEAAPCP